MMSNNVPESSVQRRLQQLGQSGILITAASEGVITELKCAMPRCHCPEELGGRDYFEEKTHPPGKWAPSADHYPVLRKNGGKLTIDNVRLAHVFCNNWDFANRADVYLALLRDVTSFLQARLGDERSPEIAVDEAYLEVVRFVRRRAQEVGLQDQDVGLDPSIDPM